MTSSNGNIFRDTGPLCGGNSPVTGGFPAQRLVTRSFDVFFDLCLNKRLSKQSWVWWFETPSCPLWRHSNETQRSRAHIFMSCTVCIRIFTTDLACARPTPGGQPWHVKPSDWNQQLFIKTIDDQYLIWHQVRGLHNKGSPIIYITHCTAANVFEETNRIWLEAGKVNPVSKVHGANMGPIWGRKDPGGPHVVPINFLSGKFRSVCITLFGYSNQVSVSVSL